MDEYLSFLQLIALIEKGYKTWQAGGKSTKYTPLAKLLARQARLGTTQDGSRNKAENYSSISATNQHQLTQTMYQ